MWWWNSPTQWGGLKPSYNSKSTVGSDSKNVMLMGCKNHMNYMYMLSITHLEDYKTYCMPIKFLYPTGNNINFPHISNGLRTLASPHAQKYLWHMSNLHGMYDNDLFLLALHSKSAHVVRCSAGDHFIIVLYCFSKIVSPEVSNLESSSSMIGRNFLGWISVRPPLSIKFSSASWIKIYWSWS